MEEKVDEVEEIDNPGWGETSVIGDAEVGDVVNQGLETSGLGGEPSQTGADTVTEGEQ